ncbi:MAG: hypothetical protein P8011_03540 [Acidihalobacter sp.]|uniref:hypothetical protein n=1 Tax=Acidihalobacter sp. TaxID=1872108 RepID=UPI00307F5556
MFNRFLKLWGGNMMQRISRVFGAGLSVLVLAVLVSAAVNTASASEAGDMAALKGFKLTPEFIRKWQAYEEAAAKRPCQLSPLVAFGKADNASSSLEQTIKAFDAQPGVHAELKKVGLTARETILGISVLMAAAMQEMVSRYPSMAGQGDGPGAVLSASNKAFYHKHKDELHRFQRKLGREMMQKNGGRMPSCLGDSGQ